VVAAEEAAGAGAEAEAAVAEIRQPKAPGSRCEQP
jgi:hypothetical protein